MTRKSNGPDCDTESRLDTRAPLIIFVSLALATLVSTLDQTIVATALPTIVDDLHGLSHIAWVSTAYLLTLSVSMPLFGKLSDLFGRKPVYLVAIAIFLTGSALCGLSGSMTELIAFRALQGIGGGGLTVAVFAIAGEAFPARERARYQGYLVALFAVASVIGPLVGGTLTDAVGWRSIFFVNVPLCAVAFAAAWLYLRLRPGGGRSRIDYAGTLLLGAFITCVVLLTSWGGAQYAWSSPQILGLAVGAALLLAGWLTGARRTRDPIIPPALFREPAFGICTAVSFAAGFTVLGCVTYLPLFLQLSMGVSVMNSGLMLLPLMAGLMVTSTAVGHAISRTGAYRWYPLASMALASVAVFLLSTMGPGTSSVLSGGYMVLLGVAAGLSQQVVITAGQRAADRSLLGVATSTITFARLVGASVGISLFGAVLNARLRAILPEYLPQAAIDRLVRRDSSLPSSVAEIPTGLRHGFAEAYAHGLSAVFLSAVPVVLAAAAAAAFLRARPLEDAEAGHH